MTRRSLPVGELVRFVLGPDGAVVPDIRQRLPGRGVWVTARRELVAEAVRKRMFGRAFRAEARAGEDLAELVGSQLRQSALGALGLERKAGRLALGFAEVDARLRRGSVALLLHASDAAADGVRKLDQAAHAGGKVPPVCRVFTSAELGLALGRANVVHAALDTGGASGAAIARCRRYETYMTGSTPDGRAHRPGFAGRTE
ncbi:hypothetical protein EDC22_103296 [Tepidamorphus gemmatus]|uniref:YlxR domain-containing protein n=1 Tax=Tepidamorphus gemmatus TaxID=747076 RepID=A0A4R3MFV3_9HYPH|nr:hypothetical protein EDC22_103296 [Tepidamorphus gemmatus]